MTQSSLSISNSNRTWRRIIVDVLCVVAVLLVLEGIVRLPPVHQYLATRLDTYENLFWHDPNMPRYAQDLHDNPDYTFWLVGSSYMMTAIDPSIIQTEMASEAETPITLQNFGMTVMTNLNFMAEIMNRWMLHLDEPEYMVLFIGEGNLSNPYLAEAWYGTYEQTFLFPDSLSDYAGAFLYNHSQLYHYLVLARNVPLVPYEDTLRPPRPKGGFTQNSEEPYKCPDTGSRPTLPPLTAAVGLNNLRYFIEMTKHHDIPLIIISLPIPDCVRQLRYADFADYQDTYLVPVAALAEEQGIPFFELDTRFQMTIPADEQALYFHNSTHANGRGAELFSLWTADILRQWLSDRD